MNPKSKCKGTVYAEIELINAVDMADAKRHVIGEEEVKRIRVNMLVDSGAYMLCINENIQEFLQLPFRHRKRCEIADGRIVAYPTGRLFVSGA